MKPLHVFDTFATTKAGLIMHFDVVIDEIDQAKALSAARSWLASIGEINPTVKSYSCTFCHTISNHHDLNKLVELNGYAIIKLEGCPA